MPCLPSFICATSEGDRNSNMFKAINHVNFHNRQPSMESLLEVAEYLNHKMQSPLGTAEIQNIVKHVTRHKYGSKCGHFENYCKTCRYGRKREPYREHFKLYSILDKKNRIQKFGCKNKEVYLWDVIDTENLSKEDKLKVYEFRDAKGITVEIDSILKANGIPVDVDAWEHYHNYITEK